MLESQQHIYHTVGPPDSLAGWEVKQQCLQCCSGKDMGKRIGLSKDRPDKCQSLGSTEEVELL